MTAKLELILCQGTAPAEVLFACFDRSFEALQGIMLGKKKKKKKAKFCVSRNQDPAGTIAPMNKPFLFFTATIMSIFGQMKNKLQILLLTLA